MRVLVTIGLALVGTAANLLADDLGAQFTKRSFIEIEKSEGALDLNHDFTIEVWTKWSDSTRVEVFAGDEAWPGMAADIKSDRERGWTLRKWRVEEQDVIDFTVGAEHGNEGWLSVKEALPKRSSDWIHLAVCRRNDSLLLFANGKRLTIVHVKGNKLFRSPTPIYLGVRKSAHENRTFYGHIRAFRVSKKARYASNFSVLKTYRFKNDDDTLVLFNFDKVAERKVFDESGHEHHGTLDGVDLVRYGK